MLFLHRIPRDISINFTTQPALFSFLYALFACVPLSGHDRQQPTTTATDINRQQQQQHCRSTTTTFQCRLALKCRSFSGSSTFVADKSPVGATQRGDSISWPFAWKSLSWQLLSKVQSIQCKPSSLPLSITIFIIISIILTACPDRAFCLWLWIWLAQNESYSDSHIFYLLLQISNWICIWMVSELVSNSNWNRNLASDIVSELSARLTLWAMIYVWQAFNVLCVVAPSQSPSLKQCVEAITPT